MIASKEIPVDPPAIDFFALKEKTSSEFIELVITHLGAWKLVSVSEEWNPNNFFNFYVVCKSIFFVFHFNKLTGHVWHQGMYRDAAKKLIELSGEVIR